jgi:hypothetical protein
MACRIDRVPHLFDPRKPWDRQTPVALPAPDDETALTELMFRAWSPDGNWLAGNLDSARFPFGDGIVLYSLASRNYRRLTEDGAFPVWTRDGRRLLFGGRAVHQVDVQTGERAELLPPTEGVSYWVAGTSPDDRVIYVGRVEGESDIWLMTLAAPKVR